MVKNIWKALRVSLLALLTILMLAIVPTFKVSAAPLSAEDVAAIASATTVYITYYDESNDPDTTAAYIRELHEQFEQGKGNYEHSGSGVIIAKKENAIETKEGRGGTEKNYTYYVLTNFHVVKDTDRLLFGIRTYDRKVHAFNLTKPQDPEPDLLTTLIQPFGQYESDGKTLKELDLSLIQFTSSNEYPVAAVPPQTSMPKVGEQLLASGWPIPKDPEKKPGRIRRSSVGKVVDVKLSVASGEEGGYTVTYDPEPKQPRVARGMSGGPVFNMQGEVVGIHGQSYPAIEEKDYAESTGGGRAINIRDFLNKDFSNKKELTFQQSPVAQSLIELGKKNLTSADNMSQQEFNQELNVDTSSIFKDDGRPTKEVFEAMNTLNTLCGVLSAYPDGTLRPNAPLIRGAGVVALNACIDQITTAPPATKEELDSLKQRIKSVEQQIAALKQSNQVSRLALAVANQSFVCNQDSSAPATLANTANGSRTMIRWASQYFTSSGYDPKLRCQQVSARMEKLRQERKLQFITSGVLNQQPVVCAALTQQDAKERRCTGGLILTLEKGDDSRAIVKQLEDAMASNSTLVKQLKLPVNKGYADLREFLD